MNRPAPEISPFRNVERERERERGITETKQIRGSAACAKRALSSIVQRRIRCTQRRAVDSRTRPRPDLSVVERDLTMQLTSPIKPCRLDPMTELPRNVRICEKRTRCIFRRQSRPCRFALANWANAPADERLLAGSRGNEIIPRAHVHARERVYTCVAPRCIGGAAAVHPRVRAGPAIILSARRYPSSY